MRHVSVPASMLKAQAVRVPLDVLQEQEPARQVPEQLLGLLQLAC